MNDPSFVVRRKQLQPRALSDSRSAPNTTNLERVSGEPPSPASNPGSCRRVDVDWYLQQQSDGADLGSQEPEEDIGYYDNPPSRLSQQNASQHSAQTEDVHALLADDRFDQTSNNQEGSENDRRTHIGIAPSHAT